jgi:hypothetical protein
LGSCRFRSASNAPRPLKTTPPTGAAPSGERGGGRRPAADCAPVRPSAGRDPAGSRGGPGSDRCRCPSRIPKAAARGLARPATRSHRRPGRRERAEVWSRTLERRTRAGRRKWPRAQAPGAGSSSFALSLQAPPRTSSRATCAAVTNGEAFGAFPPDVSHPAAASAVAGLAGTVVPRHCRCWSMETHQALPALRADRWAPPPRPWPKPHSPPTLVESGLAPRGPDDLRTDVSSRSAPGSSCMNSPP